VAPAALAGRAVGSLRGPETRARPAHASRESAPSSWPS
jgi:hypothetical protein